VLRHHPQAVQQYVQRGQAHAELGDHGRAEQDLQRALQLDGNQVEALSQLAWLWATCPSAAHRHGARAVEYATRACELSGWRDPYHLETLAAACAEAGDFPAALKWQQKAQEDRAYREHLGARADERVQMYAQGLPYRAARRGELPA
jgi:tetratricopeptide (TPR) repeat protein